MIDIEKVAKQSTAIQWMQADVDHWMVDCFGEKTTKNTQERSHRFLEEALELVQTLDCSKEDAHDLVEYVFNRPKGEIQQEIGGVSITFLALCNAVNESLFNCCYTELDRCWDNKEKIKEKHRLKPRNFPLPQLC